MSVRQWDRHTQGRFSKLLTSFAIKFEIKSIYINGFLNEDLFVIKEIQVEYGLFGHNMLNITRKIVNSKSVILILLFFCFLFSTSEIHKVWWLREASQIGQTFITLCEKSGLKHSTAEFQSIQQFLLQLDIVSKQKKKKIKHADDAHEILFLGGGGGRALTKLEMISLLWKVQAPQTFWLGKIDTPSKFDLQLPIRSPQYMYTILHVHA